MDSILQHIIKKFILFSEKSSGFLFKELSKVIIFWK